MMSTCPLVSGSNEPGIRRRCEGQSWRPLGRRQRFRRVERQRAVSGREHARARAARPACSGDVAPPAVLEHDAARRGDQTRPPRRRPRRDRRPRTADRASTRSNGPRVGPARAHVRKSSRMITHASLDAAGVDVLFEHAHHARDRARRTSTCRGAAAQRFEAERAGARQTRRARARRRADRPSTLNSVSRSRSDVGRTPVPARRLQPPALEAARR